MTVAEIATHVRRPSMPPTGARELAPCGTAAAYRRHRRNGECADCACLAAERRRQEARRKDGPTKMSDPSGQIEQVPSTVKAVRDRMSA